jgi:hypothetical protein
MIQSLIVSYQNKNLKKVVDQLIKNTKNEIFVVVFDQNTIDRSQIFRGPEYKNNLEYYHDAWDEIIGPAERKSKMINKNTSEYFLFCSDDTLVSENWDETLINFLNDKNAVISGKGRLSLKLKDLFFLKQERLKSLDFTLSNFIDRNFIFGKTENLKNMYPKNVKYHGEEEMLSLNLFNKEIDIFSGPSNLYEDLLLRTIETEYATFSIEHGYNEAIECLTKNSSEFLKFHGIESSSLNKLPYNPDDVLYNPGLLSYQDLDARKFLMEIKQIS